MTKPAGIRFTTMESSILSTAGTLFDRRGFHQTSLQDIADAIGLARPSLYHYYRNKEEILAAGVDQVTERRVELVATVRAADVGPVERLRQVVSAFARLALENPVWIRITMREEPALPAATLARDQESRLALYTTIVETIAAGVTEGSMRPVDEHATAFVIVVTMLGMVRNSTAAPAPDPDVLATATVDTLLRGILAAEPRDGSPRERGIDLVREGLALLERGPEPPG